jgi:hypothetical protein
MLPGHSLRAISHNPCPNLLLKKSFVITKTCSITDRSSGCIFSDRRTRRPAVGDSRRTVGTADVFL